MPAAKIERTPIEAIQDAEDHEIRISHVRYPEFSEWGEFVEVAEYVPSRDLYSRSFLFPVKFAAKIATAVRKAGAA